jgi:assimilatory nitrate reductase catalytic subunit
LPAIDPVSGQPELKHAGIKLLKAELPWRLTAFGWLPRSQALEVQLSLRPLLSQFAFGSCVLFGYEVQQSENPVGVLLRVADYEPGNVNALAAIELAFGLQPEAAGVMRYQDRRRMVSRLVRIGIEGERRGRLDAVLLSGEPAHVAAAIWLKDYLESGAEVSTLGRALLIPGKPPPGLPKPRGKVVCNCFNVSEQTITEALESMPENMNATQKLDQLQSALHCGTQCGSCLPEVKGLVARQLLVSH